MPAREWSANSTSAERWPAVGQRLSAGLEWDPASIFEHVLRRLKPPPFPAVHLEFRPFANLNHTVRLRDGRILVRLSDLLRRASPAVLEAVAVILLAKLYRRAIPEKFRKRYRRYVSLPGVRRRILEVRQVRGRKSTGAVTGQVHDLAQLFRRLNRKYFRGRLDRPQLAWSRSNSRTGLGHFDPAHNTIVLSRFLDHPKVPQLLVEFILYHEMLHMKHPVEHCAGRRRLHSRTFLREEKRFDRYGEARSALKSLTRRGL